MDTRSALYPLNKFRPQLTPRRIKSLHKALTLYKSLQELQPCTLNMLYIGQCYMDLQNYIYAEFYFKNIELVDGLDVQVALGLANCYLHTGNLWQAVRYFTFAYNINQDEQILLDLCDCLQLMQHYDLAAEILKKTSNWQANITIKEKLTTYYRQSGNQSALCEILATSDNCTDISWLQTKIYAYAELKQFAKCNDIIDEMKKFHLPSICDYITAKVLALQDEHNLAIKKFQDYKSWQYDVRYLVGVVRSLLANGETDYAQHLLRTYYKNNFRLQELSLQAYANLEKYEAGFPLLEWLLQNYHRTELLPLAQQFYQALNKQADFLIQLKQLLQHCPQDMACKLFYLRFLQAEKDPQFTAEMEQYINKWPDYLDLYLLKVDHLIANDDSEEAIALIQNLLLPCWCRHTAVYERLFTVLDQLNRGRDIAQLYKHCQEIFAGYNEFMDKIAKYKPSANENSYRYNLALNPRLFDMPQQIKHLPQQNLVALDLATNRIRFR